MPLTVDEFAEILQHKTDMEIVDDILVSPGVLHVTESDIAHIEQRVREVFGVGEGSLVVHTVGSAKLRCSIIEKRIQGELLPRFRPFCVDSDIDVAVISGIRTVCSLQSIAAHLGFRCIRFRRLNGVGRLLYIPIEAFDSLTTRFPDVPKS